jgi:hypothetical protein
VPVVVQRTRMLRGPARPSVPRSLVRAAARSEPRGGPFWATPFSWPAAGGGAALCMAAIAAPSGCCLWTATRPRTSDLDGRRTDAMLPRSGDGRAVNDRPRIGHHSRSDARSARSIHHSSPSPLDRALLGDWVRGNARWGRGCAEFGVADYPYARRSAAEDDREAAALRRRLRVVEKLLTGQPL